jgi:methylenetetrahydrofolate--tRNA-(uracil-5-)-methyltransferase
MQSDTVTVIGGGLAGCEAAWQCAEQGVPVRLYEMRPVKQTPAHTTDRLAEIVCSNSFKSDEVNTAPHLLKEELRRARSLLIAVAEATRVPAGAALAVDRERFAAEVTARITSHPRITVIREEVTTIPSDGVVIIATGPLTSDALAASIQALTGAERLYFYDAIAPVVDAETINYDVVFRAARYGKGGDDYLNCPLDKAQYEAFVDALLAAECVAPKAFEADKAQYFEACLPIDVAVRRGRDTLRFGPMKPVGLRDPRTGKEPYAVVQLRQENLMADSYSLVGFQNSLKWGAQKALLRMIPGLEQAEFLKFGQVHRNTYVNAPKLLTLSLIHI